MFPPSEAKIVDRIFISGMQFYGRHGVARHETEDGQLFVVDVEMELDLRPAASADSLRLTVDYGEVFTQVRAVLEGPPIRLIETVSERVAQRLLTHFPTLAGVRVRVHKPRAPIPGTFADVCVEIGRDRNDRS